MLLEILTGRAMLVGNEVETAKESQNIQKVHSTEVQEQNYHL